MSSNSVKEKQTLLAECRERISRLEHELVAARELEQQLQSELTAATNLNPPIGRLPTEMLISIFQASALADPSTPCAIVKVCRTWRNIAINVPRLWSTIQVVSDIDRLHQLPATWRHIVTYLKNSGSVGLDISLTYPGINSWDEFCSRKLLKHWIPLYKLLHYSSSNPRDPQKLWEQHWHSDNSQSSAITDTFLAIHGKAIDLLVGVEGKHMRRWQTFRLSGSGGVAYNKIPSFLRYPTPALQRLELIRLPFQHVKITMFPELPALKRLLVDESTGMWPIAHRCENLEIYEIVNMLEPHYLFGILRCTNLRKLHLDIYKQGIPFLMQEATLPHLTDLYLWNVPRWMIVPFNLPSLETLVMAYGKYFPFPQARNVYWLHPEDSPNLEEMKEMLKYAMGYYGTGSVFGISQSLKECLLPTYEQWQHETLFQTLEIVGSVSSLQLSEWFRQGFVTSLDKIDLKTLMNTAPLISR